MYRNTYRFPKAVRMKMLKKYPGLTLPQLDRILFTLKYYLEACGTNKKGMIAMPSRIVDDAWHEFILCTRAYEDYCDQAFGRFIHHTPNEAMSGGKGDGKDLTRAWFTACEAEGIDPRDPKRLPDLFYLDTELDINGGFKYSLELIRERIKKNA